MRHPPARRLFVQQSLLAAAVAMLPRLARAQAFPFRPLRVIVPWAPGGLVDTGGRVVADALSRALGQPATVENIPGAAGTLGADAVVKAQADGHTLLMGTSSLAIDVAGGRKTPYDPLADLLPVALVAETQSVVIVPAGSPIESLAQLVAAAKARPGELSYGTPGIGSPAHLFVELFCQTAGVQLLHVPYGRTQAINDLLGGRLSVMFSTVPSALAAIKGKQVRPLAVTGARQSDSLPGVPTVAEAGVPGYEASQWLGVFAPARTPPGTAQRLHAEIHKAVTAPATAQTLSSRGLEPRTATQEQFAGIVRAEVQKWSQVIRRANIKLE
ncbi:MAG: tripartite tricarboxylate transporter substrate binding protein [Ramlibacter sp.]|nr:tripartite tricarboxylate transporter substrate binding protein [Ramlibacter sp.]